MNYELLFMELLERIKKLEQEVEILKKQNQISNITSENPVPEFTWENLKSGKIKRDTTQYMLKGKRYLKNRLVLAVIKEYVKLNPNITINELTNIFDYSLQGTKTLGVIMEKEIAMKRKDYKKRFFSSVDEEMVLKDGVCLVCSQWNFANIKNFIVRAQQLGFEITEIR